MSERRQPGPLAILIGVIGLLIFSVVTFFMAIAFAALLEHLVGLADGHKDGGLGMLILFPLAWLWKKFITWCGVDTSGPGWRR